MGTPPVSESWFAEKSSAMVEHLARSLALSQYIEDEVLRDMLVAAVHGALFQAMKITSAGLDRKDLFEPGLVEAVCKDPDAALTWLKEVRALDQTERGRSRGPEGIVEYVKRVLEEKQAIGR